MTKLGEPTLIADGVAPAVSEEVARRAGLAPAGDGGGALVVLIADVDDERLERALTAAARACVEVIDRDAADAAAVAARLSAEPGLAVSLSTATGHATELARLFVEALGRRLGLDEERRQAVELAVHEAVVNALLHGNLEVGPLPKETVEDFIAHCNAVEARLTDPDYALRRLEVRASWDDGRVTVVVADAGPGFDVESLAARNEPTRKSGRGLFLIGELAEDVAIEDGGRRLVMTFRR